MELSTVKYYLKSTWRSEWMICILNWFKQYSEILLTKTRFELFSFPYYTVYIYNNVCIE